MADSSSGAGTYGAFVIVVLIAICALALFRFNLFGIHELIYGDPRTLPLIAKDDPDRPRTQSPKAGDPTENPPPDDSRYRVEHTKPLPESVEMLVQAGDGTIEIPMVLVPQGWFIMGEDDGVHANMPRRWVWMDDFYIGKTECTNEQYYAFILANGYETPHYWLEAGYNFVNHHGLRGTHNLGWVNADSGRGRVWWLASPSSGLTIDLRNADRSPVGEGMNVLVLPHDSAHESWLSVEVDGRVRLNHAGRWIDATGAEVAQQSDSRGADLVYRTDAAGRVKIPESAVSQECTIVAWIDGEGAQGVRGVVQRPQKHWMLQPEMPVVGVSWFEADAASRFFGGSLPTEAQWEKAARGSDGRRYPWGNDANWDLDLTLDGTTRRTTPNANINRWRLAPAGSFEQGASPYGVLDMLGNAGEWCADVYSSTPPKGDANPLTRGPATSSRSDRGGHTRDDEIMPVYHRRQSDPYSRSDSTARGFRLVMTPKQALGR